MKGEACLRGAIIIRYILSKKETNCLIACLFKEIYPPCKDCLKEINHIIITGLTRENNEATLKITDYGVIFLGKQAEIEKIIKKECINEKKSETI